MLCNKCKIEQPKEEFYFKRKDGVIRSTICRTCKKQYAQSPVGREKRNKYNKSEKGRKSIVEYRKKTERRRKEWYEKYVTSGRQRDIKLRACYDITLGDYKRMFSEQQGLCAICGNPEVSKWRNKIKPLAVDHNHETGEIRQLLCQKCNIGISQFGENIGYLANAISYLQKHKGSPLEAIEAGIGA